MSERIYVDRIDRDAIEANPLDHIGANRYRADDAYEPGTPETTVATDMTLAELIASIETLLGRTA